MTSYGQDTLRIKSDSVPRKAPAPRKVPPKAPPAGRTGSMVVDDSTKSVYGPKTTLWTTEREWFSGQQNYRPLDTSIVNYHRWTHVQMLNNMYQDLGNNGTPLNPIFPTVPENLGASSGFTSYGLYFKMHDVKVYDTKSPYSKWSLVWGSQGRAVTGVEFSRNITPKWNFGFNYHAVQSDRQVLWQRPLREVVSHYYDIYTNYATPKDRYKVMFAYQRIRHRVNEIGGVTFIPAPNTDSTYSSYFSPNATPILTSARGQEQNNSIHIVQQAGLKFFQVYHIFDYKRQKNWYRDAEPSADFYDMIRIDSPQIALDSITFTTLFNQAGIKGNFGSQNQFFYNGFYRLRSYDYQNRLMDRDTLAMPMHGLEQFAGGTLQYAFDSVQHVTASAEFLLGGFSNLEGAVNSRWVDASIQRRRSKPTFLQTAHVGYFDLWDNSFKPVESTRAVAFAKASVGPLQVSAGGTYTSFDNYIYFTQRDSFPNTFQRVLPVQTEQPVTYVTPEVRVDLTVFKKIHLRPQLLYSKILTDPDSVLRIPEVFFNGQIAFEGELFKGNLQLQAGIDVHWHSDYKAMGYDTPTQTFYNQDQVVTPAYLLADVFLNGKMKRGRFFFKYYNIGQLISGVGFMPTPYYRSTKNILDFGFDMILFD